MASSSGNSTMSTKILSSGSEEDLQLLMDHQRKNKRKQSNRESAKRSRMRKQKHLDDLTAEVNRLRKANSEILTRGNITTEHYLNVEAENCVLRAQMGELTQRLQSLNEILNLINTATTPTTGVYEMDYCYLTGAADNFMNPMNMLYLNQPITASADMFQW